MEVEDEQVEVEDNQVVAEDEEDGMTLPACAWKRTYGPPRQDHNIKESDSLPPLLRSIHPWPSHRASTQLYLEGWDECSKFRIIILCACGETEIAEEL